MKKNIYRDVLKNAWEITKNNKILWVFGLFAALLGNGGEYQILVKTFDKFHIARNVVLNSASQTFSGGFLKGLYNLSLYNPTEFILILVAVFSILFLIGFLIWLIVVFQVSLIAGADKGISNKKITFQEGINLGKEKFSSILGINFISKSLICLMLVLTGLPLLFLARRSESILSLILYILAFLILIPIAIIISFIAKYASAFVVLKNKNFFESINKGWHLFLDNWIVSLEMAFFLFLLNFIVGLVALFAVIIISLPFITMAIIYSAAGLSYAFWTAIIMMLFIIVAIVAFAGAVLSVYQWSSWIIFFKKLTSRTTVLSKIERTVKDFPAWIKARAKFGH
ncbi:hypothetical protein ACFL23_00480 [Patescibacteria group bacterium]